MKGMGHDVIGVDTTEPVIPVWGSLYNWVLKRVGIFKDWGGANESILKSLKSHACNVVWIEKGLNIRPNTLEKIRAHYADVILVAYSPDDMLHPGNQSRDYLKSIPVYDWHVTHKSFNVDGLNKLGARKVYFIMKACDPTVYRPLEMSEEEKRLWGADVGFVGGYEKDRYLSMLALAKAGVKVTIRGPGWEKCVSQHHDLSVIPGWVQAEDCAKVFAATKVNLHFLRKSVGDLHTARSIEIPACAAFMLAERTDEHLELFGEGKEAEFFSDVDELSEKVKYYLKHDDERKRIAKNGCLRCQRSGYDYNKRLHETLNAVTQSLK